MATNRVARAASGCELGYVLHGKAKSYGKTRTLQISIDPDWVRKLEVKEGTPLRLEGDAKAGLLRLLPVLQVGKAARRLRVCASGRGSWQIPCSGMIAEFFKPVDSMTPLQVVEATAGNGLISERP